MEHVCFSRRFENALFNRPAGRLATTALSLNIANEPVTTTREDCQLPGCGFPGIDCGRHRVFNATHFSGGVLTCLDEPHMQRLQQFTTFDRPNTQRDYCDLEAVPTSASVEGWHTGCPPLTYTSSHSPCYVYK